MAEVNLRNNAVRQRSLGLTDLIFGADPGETDAEAAFKADTVTQLIRLFITNLPTDLTDAEKEAIHDAIDTSSVAPVVPDHDRFFGWKATRVIATADLDASLAAVNSSQNDSGEFVANDDSMYPFFGIPDSVDDPNQVLVDARDQIRAFEKLAATVDDANGVAYAVWVGRRQWAARVDVRPIELIYA